MLTEFSIGDHIRVLTGDHSGKTGIVAALALSDGGVGVSLDSGGWVAFAPERLEALVDNVNHPQHYTSHPSGVEVIQITEHMGFCLGNAVKYILRSDLKGNAIEDLRKAAWYINREIVKREASA